MIKESFRFEDEDQDEDKDEALCFHHNEIFKLFRLQLGRDDEVVFNNNVTPSLHLSMRTMNKSWPWSSSSNLKLSSNTAVTFALEPCLLVQYLLT